MSNLRYSEDECQIVKDDGQIDIILKKIIWIETYKDYIKSILEIFNHAKIIIPNDNLLYQIIRDTIYDSKIDLKYIVNKHREQCFYLLLAGICLGLMSDEIKLGIDNN